MIIITTPYGEETHEGETMHGLITSESGKVLGRLQIAKQHWEEFKEQMANVAEFKQGFN